MLGNAILRARKAKGFTQEELGRHLKVTRQTIAAWEKGEAEPSAGNLYLLARVLGVSLEFFLEEGPEAELLFRADEPQAVGDVVRKIALRKAVQFTECAKMLGMQTVLPESRPLNGYDPALIEAAAEEIREWLGVREGPVCNPFDLITDKGIKVLFLELPDKASGFSAYGEELGAVIFINKEHPLERQYFTVFHELGHLVFHRKAYRKKAGDISNKIQEKTANHFAGAVLFPEEAVRKELGKFTGR